MRVVIRGNWAHCVGTDYCDALGIYDSVDHKDCKADAEDFAWNCFEPDDDAYEDDEFVGEGPDYYVEEYDPEKHDMLKAGGGSFEDDFERMEK